MAYTPANESRGVRYEPHGRRLINSGFLHGIWGFDFATVGRPREAGVSFNFKFQ
jgi:hypothetical protein